jgi:homoserine O-acetyltransferase/O-succinyltransferase
MRMSHLSVAGLILVILFSYGVVRAAEWPPVTEGDFAAGEFHFRSGQELADLRIHYRTLGSPRADEKGVVRNAILILHGTTGSGAGFLNKNFAGELFNAGQLLDANRYFIILPDDIGHGQSSRPSESLHGKFPNYDYGDMVEAEYRLVTDGLHVNHLRLVMGTSMGGMHTWLWGETYPELMDALMPLASLPEQISGRNRVWRRMICDSIRNDPQWNGGDYQTQPPNLRIAAEILWFMGSNPALRYREAPTGKKADEALTQYGDNAMKTMDANNVLYALDSSRDYDPGPKLEAITAPLLAVNSADDLINPPDLGILEKGIKRVKNGKAIVIPEGPDTQGHGTHTLAKVWKSDLAELLKSSEK